MLAITITMHACTSLVPRPPPVHSMQIQRRRYCHKIHIGKIAYTELIYISYLLIYGTLTTGNICACWVSTLASSSCTDIIRRDF